MVSETTAARRRDRLRAEFVIEIKQAARELLVRGGVEALSMAAIARQVGVSPPALYHYFDDLDAIIGHLAGDIVDELVIVMTAAVTAEPVDDLAARLRAATRAFRSWAVAHPVEYGLVFGTPTAAAGSAQAGLAANWVRRLAGVWGPLVLETWRRYDFPILDDAELGEALRAQMDRYRQALDLPDVPLGFFLVFLDCWRQIYGAVCLEVFDHFGSTITDYAPQYERMITDILTRLRLL